MIRTIAEINEKIKQGKAVVINAEEIIDLVEKKGTEKAAQEVDVVTTATFAPMCSSGAFLCVGHSKPRIKIQKAWLNDVSVCAGLAAVDLYIGATSLTETDPANRIYPGEFKYGGGHVIEDLVAGKKVRLTATSYKTDCYPQESIDTEITLKDMKEVFIFSPRNACQNYNCAVNLSDKIIYTYMGILKPRLGNANYCSAGQLSPLLNDPYYRTIGLGTRIFLGGGIGYIVGEGTQHEPQQPRKKNGVPFVPAGTLAVKGNLKGMNAKWLVGTSFLGYGATLTVGIGVPIPIIDEEAIKFAAVKDADIWTQLVDYSHDYPEGSTRVLGEVNYQELKSGRITLKGKSVPATSLSSYFKAQEICEILKSWILKGEFFLTEPVEFLPGRKV